MVRSILLLFIFLTIVVLPNWIYFFFDDVHHPTKEIIGQLIGAYLVVLAPFAFLANKYKWYLLFLLIVNIVFLPIELGFFHLYHNRFDLVAWTVTLETNLQEALGFISGYELILCIGLFLHLALMIYLYKNIYISQVRYLRYIGAVALVLVLILAYRSSNILKQDYGYTLYRNVITNKSPWLMFRLTYEYLTNKWELEKYKKIHQNFKFRATKKDQIPQVHILVIAESSRYDHWSLHGYDRKTTPSIEQIKNLISMYDAITGAGATNWATPLMITPATALNFDESIQKHSVIGAFKEAGYQTYWLSNQDKFPYLQLHADEAEFTLYIKDNNINAYDEVLLPKVERILKEEGKKNILIVLHIMGNHWKYDERYPEEYDKFKPSIYGKYVRMDDYKYIHEIINTYDNSLLYTDNFLSQLIKIVQKQKVPATVSYVSDHGENLYDTPRKLFGHGRTVSKYVDKIPWLIWYSDAYQKKYFDKVEMLRKHKNNKVSSANNLFETMLDLGQVTYHNMRRDRSLCSKLFSEEVRYVLSGLTPVDYDKILNFKKDGKRVAKK